MGNVGGLFATGRIRPIGGETAAPWKNILPPVRERFQRSAFLLWIRAALLILSSSSESASALARN